MFFGRILCLMAGLCLFVSGCQHYAAKPLSPHDIVAHVEYARHFLDEEDLPVSSSAVPTTGEVPKTKKPFTFPRAAELMSRHSPALHEAEAEYASALALANVKSPL